MISDENIGGAYVRRTFSFFGTNLKPGYEMTREQVLAMNLPNRRALIDAGYIEAWPLHDFPQVNMGERYVVHRGGGAYDVFAMKLNDEQLSKEEAEQLAQSH